MKKMADEYIRKADAKDALQEKVFHNCGSCAARGFQTRAKKSLCGTRTGARTDTASDGYKKVEHGEEIRAEG